MKKLLVIALGCLLLSGCSVINGSPVTPSTPSENTTTAATPSHFTMGSSGLHEVDGENEDAHYVLTEKETGVEYLVVTTSRKSPTAGIVTTPLLSKDGKPYVNQSGAYSNPNRFVVSEYSKDETSNNSFSQHYVLLDTNTGVQYLIVTSYTASPSAGVAITPLLDENGKPQLKNTCACTK